MRVETVQLKGYTTLGVGGPAELWTVETPEDLKEAAQAPYRVLGNGSNLLVSDQGVPERVIKLGGVFTAWDLNLTPRNGAYITGWIGAGAMLPLLVQEAARKGLSGLEGLLGIPATVGGAVRMNAGTRYGEIADALEVVEVFHDGQLRHYRPEELGFAYRTSHLPPGGIVTRVRFRLTPSTPKAVREKMALVDQARKGQPKKKSAGCAFKNPPGDSAGRLIDVHGLKGLREGQAMVSLEHGNFIVNLGGATARDVWRLVQRIRSVIPLELEWEVWGVIE
ncbi:UDP-N-acetylmuramate dehydrogenase [Marinithermus hydrothermalis]|uniref:UDP-N-acetylenolpyruvoylglucosamine reductase n=1 Tax=Marinithermus hydrothermalis (strain DSM 14884 / JCM 11576 / T1) TaxID=869210 RepID=F2NML6_MARHT|nr:UDP-N-acetylmuramate dehydrogenase [Marinithermus hydrothermalis]AEB12186.1 UDP-N-acetylenolpyruvoylglucosamine reductase [Marinithermus hydrothermalis DSM 14884]